MMLQIKLLCYIIVKGGVNGAVWAFFMINLFEKLFDNFGPNFRQNTIFTFE